VPFRIVQKMGDLIMSELNKVIETEVAEGHVPFLVGMTANRDGITWNGATGARSAGQPATVDTVLRIFSMTKAVGATAAMILVDRGKLSLDTTVEGILPEFRELKLLEGFGPDGPLLRTPRNKATIRNLATHTSGLAYEFWNADVSRYLEVTKSPSYLTGLLRSLNYPLMFEPGSRWDYGVGIDWLGRVIEKVDGRRIDRFCIEEIFEPLGMLDTRFEVDEKMAARLASVYMRGGDGGFSEFALAPPSNPEVYGMGHSLYSTAPDYTRLLRMYLNRGELDGVRIMSSEKLDTMLENHIGQLPIPHLTTLSPTITADAEFFPGRRKSHSILAMRMEEDVPGMRSAGTQFWAGVCNTHFWLDMNKNITGVIMTQSLPFVEAPFLKTYENFEKAAYRQLR
jgi:methyl acetate hydrolase